MGKKVDRIGHKYGDLTVIAEAGRYVAQSGRREVKWLCSCACGATSVVRASSLQSGKTTSCGCQKSRALNTSRGEDAVNWRGKDISYAGAHQRVKNVRGRPSEYDCVDCGGRAKDWSYRHGSPDELIGSKGINHNMPYSPNPWDYDPRCQACHMRHDNHPLTRNWKEPTWRQLSQQQAS